jgi:hypothetical protein
MKHTNRGTEWFSKAYSRHGKNGIFTPPLIHILLAQRHQYLIILLNNYAPERGGGTPQIPATPTMEIKEKTA